ncbi:MAG TPA: methyltransferase [Aeromicrobium sp.]|nr:methyltransferase [Aeromicrobium sp.]
MDNPVDVVAALRAAGSVWAEEEATLLATRFSGPRLAAAVARRTSGTPVEQVLGESSFAGIAVQLGERCFVPRARAAVLVDAAARLGPSDATIVDLGAGCGAIAAAVSARRPGAEVHAVEIDERALGWARANASAFGFSVHEGSWWAALPSSLRGRVDVAVAYLPHVPTAQLDRIHPDFRRHEPTRAVDGGPDGLQPLRDVVAGMPHWLAPGGVFVTLVAAEQVDPALQIAAFAVDEADDDAVLVWTQAT